MRVLIISGTNHKGSTYNVGRLLAEKLTDIENISEIFLPRDFGEFCCGCTNCFVESEEKCPHYEKIRPITELIDSSDVLIFTTPVYVYHASGQMKALLDHYGWRWMVHRPEEKMFSKQAVIISTAAGRGMKTAISDIADSCFFWGIPEIYRFGKAVMETRWTHVKPKIRKSIDAGTDRIAAKILSRNGKTTVPFKTRIIFRIMSIMQRNGFNPADADYWKKKDWTGKARPWK